MKKLSSVQRVDELLSNEDFEGMVQIVDELPSASEDRLGQVFVLKQFQSEGNYKQGRFYKCVKIGELDLVHYEWKELNRKYVNLSGSFKHVWAKSVRDETSNVATVTIHWNDPGTADEYNGNFYTVIVRKRGGEPVSLFDGERVGESSVWNQYSGKIGFIDCIDAATIDDSDITDQSEIEITSSQYKYRLFVVSEYEEVVCTSDSFDPTLTWEKFQILVQAGKARDVVELGDLLGVKYTGLGEDHPINLLFRVVDFDQANVVKINDEPDPDAPNVTLMLENVLMRASFDAREPAFALTKDTVRIEGKNYYTPIGDTGKFVRDEVSPLNRCYEHNDIYPLVQDEYGYYTQETNRGNSRWEISNIRKWLNSEWFKPEESDWFNHEGPATTFDVYSTGVSDGFYGIIKNIEGTATPVPILGGFLSGLEPSFRNVLAKVAIKINGSEDVYDKVFIPSASNVFGTKTGHIPNEGAQFQIYSQFAIKSRQKCVEPSFDTTHNVIEENNLATWYLRTRWTDYLNGEWIPSLTNLFSVTCYNRAYDRYNQEGLVADGDRATPAFVSGEEYADPADTTKSLCRDKRTNTFVLNKKQYANNVTPGIVPCVVIA